MFKCRVTPDYCSILDAIDMGEVYALKADGIVDEEVARSWAMWRFLSQTVVMAYIDMLCDAFVFGMRMVQYAR